MAWTTPRTWVASEVVTASLLNTHVRDNLNAVRDYMLGAQDIGSNWKVLSRRLTIANAASVVGDASAIFQVSRNATNETEGILLENSALGGWGNAMRFFSRQNFGSNLMKEAARIICTGASSWTSDALTSSNLEIHAVSAVTLLKAAIFSGTGLNMPANTGLAVGYTGAPTAGVLTVGDPQFRAYVSGVEARLEFDTANSTRMVWDRVNSRYDFLAGGGSELAIVPPLSGFAGVWVRALSFVGPGLAPNGSLHMAEITEPAAPGANDAYIFCKDNGAGKTQLMAKFSSGAAQQVAIQP